MERYRQAARAAIAIMCDFCKPPPQESTKSCMDCSASYCNECFKIHHPWGTVKAQHEYVGPTTNFRPKVRIPYLTEFGLCHSHKASDIPVQRQSLFRTVIALLIIAVIYWANPKLLFLLMMKWLLFKRTLRTYLKGTLKIRISLLWGMDCVICDLGLFSFFFLEHLMILNI